MRIRIPEGYIVPISFWAAHDLTNPLLAIMAGVLLVCLLYEDRHREWIRWWAER